MGKEHKATFKTGEISTTYGQRKWLARDLSDAQIAALEQKLQATVDFGCIPYMSEHLQKKIKSGELTFDADVLPAAFSDFKAALIEYNETRVQDGTIEHRVLLRPPSFVRTVTESSSGRVVQANLCFVININNLKIITAYWNAVDDQHATLYLRRYCRN